MTNYKSDDLFLNVDTNEIESFENLTTWESDSDLMMALSDEDLESKQRSLKVYIEDLINAGELVHISYKNGLPVFEV